MSVDGSKGLSGKVVIAIAAAATLIAASYRFFGTENLQDAPATPITSSEQIAVEALKQIDSVSFKTNSDGNIIQLSACGPDIGDTELANISKLSHLQKLTLNESGITDKSLKVVGGLTNLQTLLLEETAVTGAGLESLANLKSLQHLSLAGCSVEDSGVSAISRMTSLTILDLRQSDITDSRLRLLANLSNLERLYLNGTKISGEGLDAFEDHSSLHLLNLSQVALKKDAITNLGGFPNLAQLYLDGVPLDNEFLAVLVETVLTSLPKLTALFLANTNVSDSSVEIMQRLGKSPELFMVSLSGTPLSLEAYRLLAAETPSISYTVDYT